MNTSPLRHCFGRAADNQYRSAKPLVPPGQKAKVQAALHCSTSACFQPAKAATSGQPYARHLRKQRSLFVVAESQEAANRLAAKSGRQTSSPGPLQQRTAELLAKSNDALPYAVVASALLALIWPQAFSWFTPTMYAPALGFLMFAVGVNLNLAAFVEVFQHPKPLLVGQVCQWVIKPVIATLVALAFGPLLRLPPAVGTGLMLVGCVSGAQLSNYATFLAHPEQAPLSIVLTALSTACGVVITPLLALLLLGTRIPIDAVGMAVSIAQIVLVPVAAGLACNRFVPGLVRRCRPVLASASLVDTCACVGASLASNAAAARSPLGLKVLLPVVFLHATAFIAGFQLASRTLGASLPLSRCLCLVTGMQSSLLALLLASKFFAEPLVRLPCGLSVIVMTLGGFGLVLWWKGRPPSLEASQTPKAPVAAAP